MLVFILVTNALQSQWLWSGLVGQVLTACPTIEKVGEHSEVDGWSFIFFQLQFDWKYTLSSFLTFILYIPNHLGQQKILECFFDPQLSILGYTLYYIQYSRPCSLGYTLYTTAMLALGRTQAYNGVVDPCVYHDVQCAFSSIQHIEHPTRNTRGGSRPNISHLTTPILLKDHSGDRLTYAQNIGSN